LQKIGFKNKVNQVEEKSISDTQVEIVDEIYNQRFQKIYIIVGSKNPYFELLHRGALKVLGIN
jgi:hypothetical protein